VNEPRTFTKTALLLLVSLPVLVSGCYRFALSDLEPGSVFVGAFINQTFYRTFDERHNSDLASAFARTSGFTIASDQEAARYSVTGEIKSVSKSVIRTGEGSMPLEYLYGCTLVVTIADRRKDSKQTIEVKRSWRYVPPYGEDESTSLAGLSVFMAEETVRSITRQW
jgi:hypothetical protein